MYAATENHSILTISKWERRHARPFLTMPRTNDPQNPEPGAAVRACRASAKHIADASCKHATIIFPSGTHRLVGDSALLRHRLGMSAHHEESTSTSSRSIQSPLRRHPAAGSGDTGNGGAGAYCADIHASRVSSIAPGGPESSSIPKHRSASASASIGGCRCHGCDAPLRAGGCSGQTAGCPSGQDQFRFTLPGLESER